MSQISTQESHLIVQSLATNTDWTKVSSNVARQILKDPEKSSDLFLKFLNTFDVKPVRNLNTIKVDRENEPDPNSIFGRGWELLRHSNNLQNISSFDVSQISLEKISSAENFKVNGYARIDDLTRQGYILMDAYCFLTFWKNKSMIPDEWKEKTSGRTTFICFDGTIFRSPSGADCTIYIYWFDGNWCYRQFSLNEESEDNILSAVIKKAA